MTPRLRPILVLALALALLAVAANLVLLTSRRTVGVVTGDEGTFLAMTASLARDGDLLFETKDRARLEATDVAGRRAVILQQTGDGIAYSKPALYPLLGAPFMLLMGDKGLVALNAAALAVSLWLAWGMLRRLGGSDQAALVVVTFAGTSVLLGQVAWTMSDSLQTSLSLAGLALCLAPLRQAQGASSLVDRVLDSPAAPWVGAVLLGAVVSMRYPNLLVAAAPVAALALLGLWRRAIGVVAGLVVTLVLGLGLNWALTGAPVPYKALRATFNPITGYPVGANAGAAMDQFEAGKATHSLGIKPSLEGRVSAYAGFYFLAGRHTGLLLYFPTAILLFWAAARRPDATSLALLAAALALPLFYLIWMPRNYFGGATFLGNRYFLCSYGALLLAPRRLPSRRQLAAVWAWSGVIFFSAWVSAARTSDIDSGSQTHAYAGVFRLLPYESTAPDLDGRRDRYWSDELFRFVDPYATVEEVGFRLHAGAPPAEIVHASQREAGLIRLMVRSDRPGVEIVYRDWLKKEVVQLPAVDNGGSAGTFLEIEAAPTLRRHPFWFAPETDFFVRSFRLGIRTADGSPAEAEVRAAGPYRFVPRFYAAELISGELPATGGAATAGSVEFRIANRGRRYWATDDAIPVLVGHRFERLDASGVIPSRTGAWVELPHRVEFNQEIDVTMPFEWPQEPGRYRFTVDTVIAGLAWFSDWNPDPLASRIVEVVPAADSVVPSVGDER